MDMDIGLVIKVRRLHLNINQEQLAKRANISQGFLCNLEKGKTQPSMATIKKIACVLGCKPSDLFSFNGSENGKQS